MKELVLYFRIEINGENYDYSNYLDFRRDLFDCCKIHPYIEELGNGIFNIYIPSLESGMVYKGRLEEMDKKYKDYLI